MYISYVECIFVRTKLGKGSGQRRHRCRQCRRPNIGPNWRVDGETLMVWESKKVVCLVDIVGASTTRRSTSAHNLLDDVTHIRQSGCCWWCSHACGPYAIHIHMHTLICGFRLCRPKGKRLAACTVYGRGTRVLRHETPIYSSTYIAYHLSAQSHSTLTLSLFHSLSISHIIFIHEYIYSREGRGWSWKTERRVSEIA